MNKENIVRAMQESLWKQGKIVLTTSIRSTKQPDGRGGFWIKLVGTTTEIPDNLLLTMTPEYIQKLFDIAICKVNKK